MSDSYPTPPRRPGVELLGRYQGSGTQQPRYLIRRPDGTMVLVSPMLNELIGAMDRPSTPGQLAREVSPRLPKPLTADGVRYLIEHKLAPIGLLDDGSSHAVAPSMLSLSGCRAILPHRLVVRTGWPLRVLFHPAPLLVSGASSLLLFGWMAANGTLRLDRYDLSNPGLILGVLALTGAGALFHEVGHAAAAIYGGATPGRIGIGIFLVWPAFYTDLTDAYRLSRAGRIRTDLGGVYFNLLFTLVLAGLNSATGSPVFLAAIVVQYLLIALQFVPFARLDGYYLLTDLSGVPDLRAAGKEIRSGTGGGLRPGVRRFVACWVAVTYVATGGLILWLLSRAPSLIPQFGGLLAGYADGLVLATRQGAFLASAVAVLGLLLVGLQVAGLSIVAAQAMSRLARFLASRWSRPPGWAGR